MKKCIISFADEEILARMLQLGYECTAAKPSDRVSDPISSHSDVLYLKVNSYEIIASSCQKANFTLLEREGYTVTEINKLEPGYKTESYLNFIITENNIICNPRTALNISTQKSIIKVKQGYTRCSTICVNDNAFITDDENIYNTLKDNDMDCLKIEKGDVKLPGYDYGFIGGASVKLNDKEILFFGDIKNVNDKTAVIEFLKKYNMKALFIEDKELTDIGSALIL